MSQFANAMVLMSMKKKVGMGLIMMSVLLALVDRFSLVISSVLGELWCGDDYLQPVQGIMGDGACGFNMDIILMVSFMMVALVGWSLLMGYRHA